MLKLVSTTASTNVPCTANDPEAHVEAVVASVTDGGFGFRTYVRAVAWADPPFPSEAVTVTLACPHWLPAMNVAAVEVGPLVQQAPAK